MTLSKHLNYSKSQLFFLVALRVFIGWHFLYEGVSKMLNPNWSSVAYLADSKGIFKEFFFWIASEPSLLKTVDLINIWGLSIIGFCLILGIFTRKTIIAAISLLGLFILSHPLMIGIKYGAPSEGNYLFIDKNIIEATALLVLYFFPTGNIIGLDRFFCNKK